MNVCSINSRCQNPAIVETDDEKFCFNCYQSFNKSDEKSIKTKINKYNCCEKPNIIFGDIHDICLNCSAIHQKIVNELSYLEDDQYQTNVIYKAKKVHIPYKYFKKNFPEIKYERVYDFILNAINIIQDHYKLKRKPFNKYTPNLYNFYREFDPLIPVIEKFKNNNIILEKEITDKLYKLLYIEPNVDNNYIKTNKKYKKPVNDKSILKKYYYFNKTKNEYFKRNKYCQFNKCLKFAKYKSENVNDNKLYCFEHSVNDKISCDYNNCKKKTKDKYCQNHKFKCKDNLCNLRIMKNNSYCKIRR